MKEMKQAFFHSMVTILDIMSEGPMDRNVLLRKARISVGNGAKCGALLVELGLARRTEIVTLSDSSRITDSCLEITRKGRDFLNRYIDLQELGASRNFSIEPVAETKCGDQLSSILG